ncbi:putative salivary secreted peptide [Cochliomyia hominivorax]
MKSLKVLSFLVAAILAIIVVVKANNITYGYVGPYDRLLATDYVVKSGSWFTKQTATVVYPPKGHINYVTLSGIRIWDWGGRKQFGYASLVKGGPGYRNSTINLKSQTGKGLNFTIQYFGR